MNRLCANNDDEDKAEGMLAPNGEAGKFWPAHYYLDMLSAIKR